MINKIITLIVVLSISLFGCSSNSSSNNPASPNGYSLDPNTYFNLTFNGHTITTNGLLYNGSPNTSTDNPNGYISTQTNPNGDIVSTFIFTVEGSGINLIRDQYFPNLPYQQCEAQIYASKSGDVIGDYNTKLTTSSVWDLSVGVGNKKYDLDNSGFHFIVSSIDGQYVTGNFTCNLIEGLTIIPASGSFKIKKN